LKVGTLASLVAGVAVFAMSCTEVDDRLGAGLLPKNQRMEIEVTSPANEVKTFLFRRDSIPSSRTGYAWLGQTVDGVFGAQKNSALLQFYPYTYPYSNVEGYGLDPIIDSARILLAIEQTRGDTTEMQKFDVWAVDDTTPAVKINRKSTFYTNFPMGEYKGKKLFTFSHSGGSDVAARLFPTADGKEYLENIVKMDWDTYTVDTLFLAKLRGLIITPADDSNPAAALLGADLTMSGISLHVRNHDSLDVTAIYDTLTTFFTFRDTDLAASMYSAGQTYNNVSVNMSSYNYTGSTLGALEIATNGFTDTLPTSTSQSKLYIQSGGGVGAYLRFTDDLIDEIRNLRFKIVDGQQVGKDIAINQAMMRIWIDESNATDLTDALDKSMTRLGSYLNPTKMTPIPDYQYATEVYRNQVLANQGSTSTYTLPYGGYLNRSNAYYELDITSYVQQLAKIKEGEPNYRYIAPAIFIAPEAYSMVGRGQSILKGLGSDKPVSVRITYTIIEG
jgi:hypothetical protein